MVAGCAILGVVLLAAVLAPLVATHDPVQPDVDSLLRGPSGEHWLGTDQLGRDVFSRIVYAARLDLRIGVLAVAIMFVLGTSLGALAGYVGGFVDSIIMRLADMVAAIPVTVLVIALVFVLGQGELSLYIAFAIVGWVAYARIVRAEVLLTKPNDYVVAAHVAGLSRVRVLTRHILPNALTQAITFAMTDVVNVILAIVVLGFLGLGIAPPTPEWGSMIADGQALLQSRWHLATLPGVAVLITGVGFILVGDGLSDLLKPE
jgi:peptide/nickel transport system permease protein